MSSAGQPISPGYVDPDFPNPHGPNDIPIIVYGYTPSFALCVAAIVLFALSLVVQSYQIFRYKTWYFLPVAFACLMEVVGYIARCFSAKKSPYNILYFVLQYFFIVTAPVFTSASIYVCLSKLISWSALEGFNVGARSWLRPRAILITFIICDVVSTIVQIAGAALIGVKESKREDSSTANHILLGGLAFQSFAFLIFLSLFSAFTLSLVRDDSFSAKLRSKRIFFLVLGVTSLLVFLRTTFRLAETSEGVRGYLSTHEIFFAVLEFTPIVIVVWLLAIWHPGRWIPAGVKVRKAKGGVVDVEMSAISVRQAKDKNEQ